MVFLPNYTFIVRSIYNLSHSLYVRLPSNGAFDNLIVPCTACLFHLERWTLGSVEVVDAFSNVVQLSKSLFRYGGQYILLEYSTDWDLSKFFYSIQHPLFE